MKIDEKPLKIGYEIKVITDDENKFYTTRIAIQAYKMPVGVNNFIDFQLEFTVKSERIVEASKKIEELIRKGYSELGIGVIR